MSYQDFLDNSEIASRAAAAHLLSFFPDIDLTIDDYLRRRDEAQDVLWPTVPFLPGARRLIEHLHAHNVPTAIATGSRRLQYELKTSRLQKVFKLFGNRIVCADDGVVDTNRGKPHPDIYLYAAKHLLDRPVGDVKAADSELSSSEINERTRGLVFEDAIPGFQAGKRAGMKGMPRIIYTSLVG
jgi:pseudouridine-5'-monophosphatase